MQRLATEWQSNWFGSNQKVNKKEVRDRSDKELPKTHAYPVRKCVTCKDIVQNIFLLTKDLFTCLLMALMDLVRPSPLHFWYNELNEQEFVCSIINFVSAKVLGCC